MSEEIVVGNIVEGTIVRIKPFGAIVSLPNNKQGLVHISQVSSKYVEDISKFLNIGDVVKVKILTIDPETNKFSLSIKEAMEKPAVEKKFETPRKSFSHSNAPSGPATFEDKMGDWLKSANERQAVLNKRSKRK